MADFFRNFKRGANGFKHLLDSIMAVRDLTNGGLIKTVSISMVRNEQDIIEPFVRHHAELFDLVFILDNRSTDNTRRIIASVANELGNVVYCDVPDRAYNQSKIMTRALHSIQSVAFAEYIFLLDADEFVSASSRSEMERILSVIPKGGVGLLPWTTLVPDPSIEESAVPDPLLRMRFKRSSEVPEYFEAVFRAHGSIDPSVTVDQGNHSLRSGFGLRLPSVELRDLPLLHFPLRSTEQLAAKGVLGWIVNQARTGGEQSSKDAYQWNRLHDLVKENGRLSPSELVKEAMCYAQWEPSPSFEDGAAPFDHGISYTRRYSDGSFMSADYLIKASQEGRIQRSEFTLPDPPKRQGSGADIKNAFDGKWHWQFLFLDVPPIRFAIERYAPSSVLDLGCGNGLYPLLYKHLGVFSVLGVDGIETESVVLPKDMYCKADLQKPFDAGRKFDLVFSLEVAEHLDPDATGVFFDTIAGHAADTIVFSMAEPGQPGNGHINCLPISSVLDLWESRGWHPDLQMTLGIRAISSMSWFRRNLLVLKHTGDTSVSPASEVLRRIGSLPFRWYGQPSGKREVAFSEPLPSLRKGYGLRRI